jgi:phosphatidylglycerophosphatase A
LSRLARLIATGFYLGYAKAPGTAGSLGGLGVAWVLHQYAGFGALQFGILGAALVLPAIWASQAAARESGLKDPQHIVVDEVVGMWLALGGAARLNWKSWLGALVLFRIFDVWKPPPVRQCERIPGGAGIVADDVAAGLCAALVLYAAGWFNLY